MAELAVDMIIGLVKCVKEVIDQNAELCRETERLRGTMEVIVLLLTEISRSAHKQHRALQAAYGLTKKIAEDMTETLIKLHPQKPKNGFWKKVCYKCKKIKKNAGDITKELLTQEEHLHKAVVLLNTGMSTLNLNSATLAAAAANISEKEKKDALVDLILGKTADARPFWTNHFGPDVPSVAWAKFEDAVKSAGDVFGTPNAEDMDVIRLCLDEDKDGTIAIWELAKWVGAGTLREAVYRDKEAAKAEAKVTASGEPGEPCAVVSVAMAPPASPARAEGEEADSPLPDIIWVDPHPDNNEDIIQDCVEKKGLAIACVDTAKEAIEIFKANRELLHSPTLRCISNNYKWELDVEGKSQKESKLSAAEELIRFLRRSRSNIPVLIYCGRTYDHAQAFIKAEPRICRRVRATQEYEDAEQFAFVGPVGWD